MKPPEYRADAVLLFRDTKGKPALAVIVEVQLSINERKRSDWLGYTAATIRQHGCNACVLVVTPRAHVARWARKPFSFGFSSTFAPLVIGPSDLPLVIDPEEARKRPFLAILSAVAHGQDEIEQAVRAASIARDALANVNFPEGDVYFDLIKASLSEAARKAFEMFPASYEYQDESLRNSFHKGQTEGEANSLLLILKTRGLPISTAQRTRIENATDSEELLRMIASAVTVTAVDDLFL